VICECLNQWGRNGFCEPYRQARTTNHYISPCQDETAFLRSHLMLDHPQIYCIGSRMTWFAGMDPMCLTV
jgi:hypothetical protein